MGDHVTPAKDGVESNTCIGISVPVPENQRQEPNTQNPCILNPLDL
jgi:hypothetical protein